MSGENGTRALRVQGLVLEAIDVMSVTLVAPDGATLPDWEPGAHVDIVLPGGLTSQYSLCGATDARYWKIAVLLEREGKGVSRYIHERLRPGDMLLVGGPRNHFPLDDAERFLFIAGGIGITPMLPMIAAAERLGRPWTLAYGGRSLGRMAFIDELDAYGGRVRLYPQDDCGMIPIESLLGQAEEGSKVYCCGPEPLLAAVEQLSATLGRAAPRVERFAAKPQDDIGPSTAFRVTLERSGKTLTVPANRTIVEVLEENQVFVPTSCEEGVCGSCETRVLCGQVDHRDALLSPAERLHNQTMMICVSRAKGPHLTLDL
nr:flavodoxin reductases (ferredoxin-NADPH reductases) family 1 [uncultured bacterium]